MIRRALIVTSLLLAMATLALIVVSLVSPRYLAQYRDNGFWYEIGLEDGRVSVLTLKDNGHIAFTIFVDSFARAREIVLQKYGYLPAPIKSNPMFPHAQIQVRQFKIDLGLPVILFLAYPIIVLVMFVMRKQQRRSEGRCLGCGYHLTGNTSGVCPECGKPT